MALHTRLLYPVAAVASMTLPILLGAGKTVFEGIKNRYPLRLLSTRQFKSGNVVMIYQPGARADG
jgi:hypothetical protein